MTHTSCLYSLKFPNGKLYIGMTRDFYRRLIAHKTKAKTAHQLPVQNAILKYGFENVSATILVVGSESYIKELEVKAISAFDTRCPNGYNITSGGDGARDFEHTEDAKERISAASRTLWSDTEYKAKMLACCNSDENKARMSKLALVVTADKEIMARARAASAETRKTTESRLLTSLRSKENWGSPEYRAKIALARELDKEQRSNSMKERWKNPEYRRRCTESHIGKKHSEESKPKRSAALKAVLSSPEHRARQREQMTGRRFITDGIVTRCVKVVGALPDGWAYGTAKKAV